MRIFSPTISGSLQMSGSGTVSGSWTVTGGVTASVFGTASWASNAISSSFASSSQNTQDLLVFAKNITGVQIDKGKVVRISGATGDNALISLADWTDDANSANTLGLTTTNIANDDFGYVMTEGTLLGIDTSMYAAGQLLFLASSGSMTGSAPTAPLHAVRLGQVLRVQGINGSMYIRVDNGYEIEELHDVRITAPVTGQALIRSGSLWINGNPATASLATTASFVQNAQSASYVLNAVSSSLASTASATPNALITASVTSNIITFTKGDGSTFPITVSTGSGGGGSGVGFPFTGSAIISGSLQVTGSVSVNTTSGEELAVTAVGVRIGNLITDTHVVTGSMRVSGSITGSLLGTASFAANANTASFAIQATSASYILNAVSSSFSTTASFAATAALAPAYVLSSVTSSMLAPYVLTSQTSSMIVASASFAATASFFSGSISNAISASYAATASLLLGSVESASFASTASATPNAVITASVSSNTITFTKGDGSTFPITVAGGGGGGGTTTNPITFDDSGSGAVPGTTFDGSVARTISYNSIGANKVITNGPTPPTGGIDGDYYSQYDVSNTLYYVFNRQSASYVLSVQDIGRLIEMDVATANNLTVPTNATAAFPVGTRINIIQYGAGQTTILAASGVTIRSISNFVKISGRYGIAFLVKIATDEWYLTGNLTA